MAYAGSRTERGTYLPSRTGELCRLVGWRYCCGLLLKHGLPVALGDAGALLGNAGQVDAPARRLPLALDGVSHSAEQTAEEIEQRSAQIQAATLHAAEVPLSVAQKSVELLQLAQQLVLKGNLNAISDAGSAAALAGAALIGAGLNVRINATGLENKADASQLIEEIYNLERQGEQLRKIIREQLNERGGLS